jgi:hypothetical protein
MKLITTIRRLEDGSYYIPIPDDLLLEVGFLDDELVTIEPIVNCYDWGEEVGLVVSKVSDVNIMSGVGTRSL